MLPFLNRVPGETKLQQKEFKLEKDLTKHSRRELLDLEERQSKLLENKSWLRKLPDKGEKIQNLYDRVIEALDRKKEIDEAASLLKNLNLGSKDIANLEWEGTRVIKKQQLDSDDDEDSDPLAVLISTNSITSSKKIIKHQPQQQSLITEQDLKEVEEIENEHLQFDPVLEQMCRNEKLEPEPRFLPYNNVKHREHTEPSKLRDNTAATPPVTKQTIKMLTLRESMEAENKNRKKTKEVTEKHAVERLKLKTKELKSVGLELSTSSAPHNPSSLLSMTNYRLPSELTEDVANDSDESYESEISGDEAD